MSRSESFARALGQYAPQALIELFESPEITEVYCNTDLVLRSKGRRGRGVLGARFDAISGWLNVVAAHHAGSNFDRGLLEAELPAELYQSARLQAWGPPVVKGYAFIARKRPERRFRLEQLVARGAMTPEHGRYLRSALSEGKTIVVAGGTDTGKTTVLAALLFELADCYPDRRVLLLEDVPEIAVPSTDRLEAQAVGDVGMRALLAAALRSNPDHLIVGEVRGDDAFEFLDGAVTGHRGGMCSVHASSPAGALRRLERLAGRVEGVKVDGGFVADAVQVVVQLESRDGERKVVSIHEVCGWSEATNYSLRDVAPALTKGKVR